MKNNNYKDIPNVNVEESSKNITNHNINNIHQNAIQEEDDLEKFYETQQIQMEKAMNKKNNNFNNSKNKFKENSNSKNKSNKPSNFSIDHTNQKNIRKNSVNSITPNINKTTNMINNINSNSKKMINVKKINTNTSVNLNEMNTSQNIITKSNLDNGKSKKHSRNNSSMINGNVTDLTNKNIKNSMIKNSPIKINKNTSSYNIKNLNKSYSKRNDTIDNTSINKTLLNNTKKIEKNNLNIQNKIINDANQSLLNKDQKKIKVNISATNLKNNTVINNNKISYDAYESFIPSKNNENTIKISESTKDLKTKNIIALKNKDEILKSNTQNSLMRSSFKDYSKNTEKVHNVIKLKISNNKVEELQVSKENVIVNSKDKNKEKGNYKSIFEKKRDFLKNNNSNANISVNMNNISNNNKNNFLTIQEPENYVNNINQVGNTFRKDSTNLKINTNNNNNLININNDNLISSKTTQNNKNMNFNLFNTGIHSLNEKIPIKLSSVVNSKNTNDKVNNKENKNTNNVSKINYGNDLENNLGSYLKKEKDNNYSNLINKSRYEEKEKNIFNKKINNSFNGKASNNLKKINRSKNKNESNSKIKICNEEISQEKINEENLIEKILKENNISINKGFDSDDKRCLTSNEKLSEFFLMNLNFEKEKKNNNILNEKNEFSEIKSNFKKVHGEKNKDINKIIDDQKIKNNYGDDLLNSNISNNIKISPSSYRKNFSLKRDNENNEFIKDISLSNLMYLNENSNVKASAEKQNAIIKNDNLEYI